MDLECTLYLLVIKGTICQWVPKLILLWSGEFYILLKYIRSLSTVWTTMACVVFMANVSLVSILPAGN